MEVITIALIQLKKGSSSFYVGDYAYPIFEVFTHILITKFAYLWLPRKEGMENMVTTIMGRIITAIPKVSSVCL